MTNPTDPLAEIRERVEAASRGPWEFYREDGDSGDDPGYNIHWPAGMPSALVAATFDHGHNALENAEFITNARTDLPTLLAALDAVLAEADELDRLAEINREEAKRLDAEGQESLGRWAQGNAQASAAKQIRQAAHTALDGGGDRG